MAGALAPNTSRVWMKRWRPMVLAQVKPSSTIWAVVKTSPSRRYMSSSIAWWSAESRSRNSTARRSWSVSCEPPGATRQATSSSVLLTDRVAVVTGGGGGIGRGVARALATFGARVAVWERDAETAASAAKEIGGLGLTTDVRESAEVDMALGRTIAELGPVAI